MTNNPKLMTPQSTPQSDSELFDILDSWLVHDDNCPISWSSSNKKDCDCIAKNQRENIANDVLAWADRRAEKLVAEARLNELEYIDPDANITVATGGVVSDMTVKDRIAALTATKKEEPNYEPN